MVNRDDFRSAMSRFATGVTVISSVDDNGEPHSMTANSFTSVCLDPPTVLVCVAHGTNTYGFVSSNGRFGVNILLEEQEPLGAYFAKRPEDRVGDLEYSYNIDDSGVPVLQDSMVSFSCNVSGTHVYGDHTIYVGEVVNLHLGDSGEPLMFFQSRWYHPASQ
ncbi:MAG: flavin reductase family protein [Chloroflexota bacterium]|nr:flavin reductase family protein [Chloroflexota bacterium]